MNFKLLTKKAEVVIKYCMGIKPGEDFLILVDGTLGENLTRAFSAAAATLRAETQVLTYNPPDYLPMREFSFFAGASLTPCDAEPPSTVSAAIKEADANIFLTSDMRILFSQALREALRRHRRIIFLPYITEENFVRLLPSSTEEVNNLRGMVEKGTEIFERSQSARITSRVGTDIRMDLGEYRVIPHLGVAEAGSIQILPGGQVTLVPNEDSAEGVLVIDRSIAAPEYKELRYPITLKISSGMVSEIDGNYEAQALKRFLVELEDPNMYHVTELSIGTNPRCRFAGIAAPAEDTHTLGSVNMALGCDVHIGGSIRAKAHIDMTMRWATLLLDDRIVVEDGILRI
ncbi:MAG: hypothetical protein GTO54_04990 [Nitrososphaeria archaeon]|nr:hypothetical protein [Nitrososphaeria archaeon]